MLALETIMLSFPRESDSAYQRVKLA
jgi:hypothetical protein